MRKITYLLFLLLGLNYISYGQSYVSLGPNFSFGNKTFAKNAKFGFGGSVEAYVRLLKNGNGGARLYSSYDWFKNPDTDNDNVAFLPIRLGYQHFLYENAIFVYADAGLMNFLFPSDNYSGFTFGLGGGYRIDLSQKSFVQFSAIYNHSTLNFSDMYSSASLDYNYFTLRFAYGLDFGPKKSY